MVNYNTLRNYIRKLLSEVSGASEEEKVYEKIKAHAETGWIGIHYGIGWNEVLKKQHDPYGWLDLPGVLSDIINEKGYKIVAEIGLGLGGQSAHVLHNTDIERMFGVDPYIYYPNDDFSRDVSKYGNKPPQYYFDCLYGFVKEKLEKDERYNLIRESSVEASKIFNIKYFDCVFIDGEHTYSSVKADLGAWFPKVRKGGTFCGDDYWMQEVKKAVDEFCEQRGLDLTFRIGGNDYKIWCIEK